MVKTKKSECVLMPSQCRYPSFKAINGSAEETRRFGQRICRDKRVESRRSNIEAADEKTCRGREIRRVVGARYPIALQYRLELRKMLKM